MGVFNYSTQPYLYIVSEILAFINIIVLKTNYFSLFIIDILYNRKHLPLYSDLYSAITQFFVYVGNFLR